MMQYVCNKIWSAYETRTLEKLYKQFHQRPVLELGQIVCVCVGGGGGGC